ncbi:hypothetical protein J1614_010097 [Plenodomus biglobosus]|nr:hypothetical protein J1614_010097 [Plenodomus biglobosus]
MTSPELYGNCGTNCTGYDNCYIVNREQNGPYDWRTSGPVASLSSAWSVADECIGTIPLKSTQGLEGREAVVPKHGCIVMEVQDWIDGINQPAWQREKKQIFGPGGPSFSLEADYVFSTTP